MARDTLRIAVPMSIRSIEPWRTLNNAEEGVLRLTYDSALSPLQQRVRRDLARVEIGASAVAVRFSPHLIYADGRSIPITNFVRSIILRLESFNTTYSLQRLADGFTIADADPDFVLDVLRSAAAVPFRLGDRLESPLGSDPATSGQLTIAAADERQISLVPNPRHPDPVALRQIDIIRITDPGALRAAFAADQIDVMVVAADELEILEGREQATRDGYLVSRPSNAISMLSVRPEGTLADAQLRHLLSHWFPRQAFQERFLGAEGQAAYGFSPTMRYTPWGGEGDPPRQVARHAPELEFIVPPGERAVARAHWLAEEVYRAAGLSLRVVPLPWGEYWSALSDPAAGDLFWCGAEVQDDHPRHWIRYNLFGDWLPLPASAEPLRRRVWSGSEEDLLAAERQLLSDGWVIPLYHHYQTYLVRRGLQGFTVEASDWPLPGVHHVSELRWL